MRNNDTRKESQKDQDGIRRKVVHAVAGGMRHAEAARVFGVSRTSIWAWMKNYQQSGEEGLRSQKRGRKPCRTLSSKQAASIRKSVIGKIPGQLRLPGFLWTRECVGLLILQRFGLRLSRWTVGRYLKDWGLTVQKPAMRVAEQNPEQVRYWLQAEYPAIARRAAVEKAEIFWGNEMGLRSVQQTGTTWGEKGQTSVVRTSGNRLGCNMISAITNRGRMSFMVFPDKLIAEVFITFLECLIRHNAERKVFLIVDRHPVHRSKEVSKWISAHIEKIEMFYLPANSPELIPD